MSNERFNDPAHWKNKLDELNSVPGEPLHDKLVAWGRLHTRLGKKPARKKALFYWLAAACLVTVLLLQWILVKREGKQSTVVKDNKQYIHQPAADHESPATDINSVTGIPPSVDKKQAGQLTQIKRSVKHIDHSLLPVVPDTHQLVNTPGVISQALIALDTTVTLMAKAPVRKPLRIVHINEVSNPVEEVQTARNTLKPAFSIKFNSVEDLSPRYNDNNPLKIRLSSKQN